MAITEKQKTVFRYEDKYKVMLIRLKMDNNKNMHERYYEKRGKESKLKKKSK